MTDTPAPAQSAAESELSQLQNEMERFRLPAELQRLFDDKEKDMTPEQKAAKKAMALESTRKMFLERFHIEDVDIEKEIALIGKKQSKLSRSKRDAVVAYHMLFIVAPKAEKFLKEQKENEACQNENPPCECGDSNPETTENNTPSEECTCQTKTDLPTPETVPATESSTEASSGPSTEM
jgi:hypothetical protein